MEENQRSPRYVTGIARRLRREETAAEESLWNHLRNRRLYGAKFRRQHPIGRYVADFYCHDSRLVVELQGSVHRQTDQIQYDRVRQEVLEQQGLKVLSFSNEEVMSNLDEVLAVIRNSRTPGPSPSGRGETEAQPKSG